MGVPVIVPVVVTEGVRSRTGREGSEVVESAASSRFFRADFKFCTSTPESTRFGGGDDRDGGVSLGFGGRTTIERRSHRYCSFSGIAFAMIGSLFCVLNDLDFAIAGFAMMGLGATGELSSFSFLGEKNWRIASLTVLMDFPRFDLFVLFVTGVAISAESYSMVSTCVASEEVGTAFQR